MGAACSGGFGGCQGGLEVWLAGVGTGEGVLWCGTLVALWLMLDVDVGAEPSLGGVTMGSCLCGRGLLWDCATVGVHTFLQRALCSLWGHSRMVA